MTKKEAQKRIEKLRETIDRHRYLYHVRDQQEISDAALDSLKHELFTLEQEFPDFVTPSSPTQRVGGAPLKKFGKVAHRFPMLSLEDIFFEEEFVEWEERLSRIIPRTTFDYYAEVKMDGLAVSLRYENGFFAIGATRGDGRVGEDVTTNLKTIDAIPLELRIPTEKEIAAFLKKYPEVDARTFRSRLPSRTGTIEIRGEIFMRKDAFEKLNHEQKKKELPLFANPRNVAAGSIRQLDSKITASRGLDFFGYALMDEESFGITTHEQAHALIRLLGIKTNLREEYCADRASIMKYHESIQKERERLSYWTDGIVVSVNNNAVCKKLGVVGKTPRGSIAYKFPAQQVTTVLREVHFQVGRTGALTPVATFEPVFLAGTTVTHASLHNSDEIERLDVRIGDTVIIEKAGDVIPKVIRVMKEMRTGKEKVIPIPQKCPVCDSPTVRHTDEVALYCSNKQCFAQGKERITHFISKKAFDIDGLGEKIVEQLMGQGLIHDPADFFTLKQGDLEPLERFAEKSASNLIEAIAEKKKIEFARFLYALGIRHVGEETAYDLARYFSTLKEIQKAQQEDFERVPNIGSVVAKSIFQYFRDEKQKEYIEKLIQNGVEIAGVAQQKKSGSLLGKTFVVTGTLPSLTREEAHHAIREHGGDVSSSVSKQTDYVVVGDDPGSKYDKAKKFGITILSEKKFLDLVKKK